MIHALVICYFLFLYSGLNRAVVEGITMKQQMVTLPIVIALLFLIPVFRVH